MMMPAAAAANTGSSSSSRRRRVVLTLTGPRLQEVLLLLLLLLLIITTDVVWRRAAPQHPGVVAAAAFLPSQQPHRRILLPRQDRRTRRHHMAPSPFLEPPAVTLDDVTCTHGGGDDTFPILQQASYVLPRRSKVALVGRNGAGKSSLLKLIMAAYDRQHSYNGVTDYDYGGIQYGTGRITIPRDVRVMAHVEQEPPLPGDVTVADALLGITTSMRDDNNQDKFATVRRYRRAAERAAQDPEAFARAAADMDARSGGWDVLTKADQVATNLRVRHLQEQPLSKLSGGERKRVALAAALVREPDVLLLDEPTNFLSLAGVEWLADELRRERLTILLVTHDRAFLDDVCDRVLELDRGRLYEYKGKYMDYLEAKEKRLELEDLEMQAAKAKYRVELDWMRRQPQARQTKAKSRIDAFRKLEKAVQPRPREANIILESSAGVDRRRIGGKILSMRNVNLQFGDKIILKDFSYDFCKGDRICLSGANGVGKTTFIKVLTGEQEPDSGTIELGDTIVFGVYDQLGIKIEDPNQTVLDFVVTSVQASGTASAAAAAATNDSTEARQLLQKFEFPQSRWQQRVSFLSGGERRRLQMLSVISKQPNFLVMDEPSVDLDIPTLQALENFLLEFKGVLLIVSHDRYFSDKVTDHLFIFEGDGEVKDFNGRLSEYASTLVELENESIGESRVGESVERKASYKEDRAKRNEIRNTTRRAKKDMDNLEKSIEKLKENARSIQQQIDDSGKEGWTVLADLTEQLNKTNEDIDAKEMQWLELAELVEEAEIEV